MSNIDDEAVDALLRDTFEGPVPAGDFCDRVMRRLPPRSHRRTWPLAVGIGAGIFACWSCLLASPAILVGRHDWLTHEHSWAAIILVVTAAGLSLLALGWAAFEGD